MSSFFSPQQDPRLYKCSETGEEGIEPGFVERLDALRAACDFPFIITSGYRSPRHSKERVKDTPGQHAKGIAADIAVQNGSQRYRIVAEAIALGFGGIGVAKTFIHVDTREGRGIIWTY